jgi:hypothetical protein
MNGCRTRVPTAMVEPSGDHAMFIFWPPVEIECTHFASTIIEFVNIDQVTVN